MTNKNSKRIKKEKIQTEEQVEAIRFVRILLILIVIVLGVYFFTRLFVTKDLFDKDSGETKTIKGEINYNKTLIGNMFNKSDNDYYVILYNTEDINAIYYSGLITNYQKNEKALKVYFADLSNPLNEKYAAKEDTKVNVNTTDFDKFRVGDLALIKISNGKITKALTSEKDTAKELEYVKSTES